MTLEVADDIRHSTVVPLAHDDVAQSMDATAAVGVRSMEAKARPLSVAVRPPEEGALLTPTPAQLSTGAYEQNQRSTADEEEDHALVMRNTNPRAYQSVVSHKSFVKQQQGQSTKSLVLDCDNWHRRT